MVDPTSIVYALFYEDSKVLIEKRYIKKYIKRKVTL